MVEDITQRKSAVDALRESDARFRAFMDHSPALAWAKDEEGRYVYLNRACEELLGSRDNLIGKTDFDFFPVDVAQVLRHNDQRVLQTGDSLQTLETTPINSTGIAHWLITKFLFQNGRGQRYLGGVAIDFTEFKRIEESLRSNSALLRNLIAVQEQERQTLCHEFHDGLMQYAFGAVMSLSAFRDKHPGTDAAAVMDAAIAALRKGIDDGRRAIRGIRPAVLDDFGLVASIEDLVDQQSSSGILVTFKCDPDLGKLSSELESAIYRIVQEALNNARKHSGTDVIQIKLQRDADDLLLEVIDFGCGFEVEAARKRGFGLLGMMERVRLFGGECRIESAPEVGTRIVARIPLAARGEQV
jgi:PAS domain S-box-containing protein